MLNGSCPPNNHFMPTLRALIFGVAVMISDLFKVSTTFYALTLVPSFHIFTIIHLYKNGDA